MKTSEEVYNRILTDARFNPCNFAITYWDGIKKKYIDTPLIQWKPIKSGGDIPWTRVYYIKYVDKIVWNRNELKYNIDDCAEEINYLPNQFKILSLNVMSDIYDHKMTNIEKRKNQILNFLNQSDCDIVCFQEITPEFYSWLVENVKYKIVTTNSKTNNVIIMSKINPKSYEIVDLDNRGIKKALIASFQLNELNYLNVVGIHLTSNTHKNSKSTRIQQISKIIDKLSQKNNNNNNINPSIILGDTNETDSIDLLNNYIDSNNSISNTYCPSTNLFAKELSTKKIDSRYDRIYHRDLECESFTVENIAISDHYPIVGIYKFIDNSNDQIDPTTKINTKFSNINTTFKTSLCVIPPWDISSIIPKYNDKWMPHINLFWGFVPESEFEKYSVILSKITNTIEPFEIRLNKIDILIHENNTTICLRPDSNSTTKLKKLYDLIYDLISDTLGNIILSPFNPHLSIETIDNNTTTITDKFALEAKYNYDIKFVISDIKFISRETSEYMCVKKIIPLNSKENNLNLFINKIIDFLSTFCEIKICGSRFFGQNDLNKIDDSTDLDLLGIGQIDREKFFSQLIKPIMQSGLFVKYDIITNAHTYEMKLYSPHITVDLQYINQLNKHEKYYQSSWNIYAQPVYALEMIRDQIELFDRCIAWTRGLFKKFKSFGQMYGYLPGISILILTIYTIKKFNPIDVDSFVEKIKLINYDEIISLRTETSYNIFVKKTKSDELMIIQELIEPYSNTIRNITKSTKKIIIDILKNNTITIKLPYTVVLKFESNDDEHAYYLKELNNWLCEPIMKMIIKLENNSNCVIKPFDKWYLSPNNRSIFFKLRHNCETNILDNELEKITTISNNLIKSKNISFCVVKKNILS